MSPVRISRRVARLLALTVLAVLVVLAIVYLEEAPWLSILVGVLVGTFGGGALLDRLRHRGEDR